MSLSSPAAAISLPNGFSEQIVISSGLSIPVGMAFLPDGRLLVIQQGNNTNVNADDDAILKLWANATLGTLLTMPEVNTGGERGLLGIAVDPGFPSRPYIYLFYTNVSPQKIQIARYTVGGDLSDSASANLTIDSNSKVILLDDIPDDASNHNGGTLRFGPDGKLYISLGDDADRCDAQDLTLLKGKILRISVDGVTATFNAATDRASLDPGNNPFSGDANLDKRLIWAYGLRNPFRFSIDPVSGRIYVGDVGNSTREEASEGSPPAAGGGADSADNFAWPYFEGTYDVPTDPNCGITPPPNHLPILEYDHSGQGALSVMGGPVYRGNPYPNNILGDVSFPLSFEGVYFASEYYLRFLRARRWDPGTSAWVQITGGVTMDDFATDLAGGSSDWTVGPDGALYYVSQWTNSVRKIAYIAADFDRDGILDGDDEDDDNDGLTDEFEDQNGLFSMDTDSDDDGIMDGLDPLPGTPSNACTGDNATYGTVVDSMDITCGAAQSITIEPVVEVQAGFLLQLISPRVELRPGLTINSGGRLSIHSVDPGAVGPW
ncbi:MAG: PQQ-dependent sugar dehydrogenase [Gammaproteobacteria bacterium]|nr:PQQ-dependent sugar dehydrogenase [Gammaproteobacteria bacterium]MDH3465251.1 PQQ-dependent sugar dehydrogenase [Gammaproteobacteria bacterium]